MLVQGSQHAERHLVVGHEDGGDVGVPRQLQPHLVTRSRAPVANENGRDLRAGGLERRAPALEALLGLEEVPWAGDVPDGAVPEVEQQLRCADGSGELVDGDERH